MSLLATAMSISAPYFPPGPNVTLPAMKNLRWNVQSFSVENEYDLLSCDRLPCLERLHIFAEPDPRATIEAKVWIREVLRSLVEEDLLLALNQLNVNRDECMDVEKPNDLFLSRIIPIIDPYS